MWKFHVSAKRALEWLCEGRPVCEPNPGFCEQLRVWEGMLKIPEGDGKEGGWGKEREEVYRTWLEVRYTGTWYNGELFLLFFFFL